MSIEAKDLERLREPFQANEVEWRITESGMSGNKPWAKCVAYITNRAIMDRLDLVCGPANWRNEFTTGPDGGVVCSLSIKVDGEWITKSDGASNTNVEGVKGGLSSAMKRAAVQWGMGRYLYDIDMAWANISPDGVNYAKTKSGGGFRWNPPKLPDWAVPKGTSPQKTAPEQEPEPSAPAKSEAPGSEASVFSKAMACVRNAPTISALERYRDAYRARSGEFTKEQYASLESESDSRRKALSASDETAFVQQVLERLNKAVEENNAYHVDELYDSYCGPSSTLSEWAMSVITEEYKKAKAAVTPPPRVANEVKKRQGKLLETSPNTGA